MDFTCIFPRIIKESVAVFKDTSIEEIKNIVVLKEELIAVGYNPNEVNYMIATFSNNVDIAKLNSKQLKKTEERLKEQLSIARQCIAFIRDPQ